MACNRPKCVEARKKAALKAGRGLPTSTSTPPVPVAQSSTDNQPAPSANGVAVSTVNKKGIVQ